ncbi:hypothetical protein GCM10009560_06660 [Nonomuraea longicatena]|uniref:Uncharacterized protein n=1 Tax=Nonomuraea longicatena TaxID=83682 RepID=A0ABN1NP39_9ACTN
MVGIVGRLSDRILDKLAPKATAKADDTWWAHCYCYERSGFGRYCQEKTARSPAPLAGPTRSAADLRARVRRLSPPPDPNPRDAAFTV